jgi:uncharacterized protein
MTLNQLNIDTSIKDKITAAGIDAEHDTFSVFEELLVLKESALAIALLESIDINLQNRYGWTPLHVAIRYDMREVFDSILKKDPDINRQDCVGWTPIMEAVMDDKIEYVKVLLDLGADTTIANERGATAAMLVQKFSRTEMMSLF